MPDDLLVLTPLRGELEPALGRLGPGEVVAAPPPAAVRRYRIGGRSVLAGWSGIGGEATERTLRALAAAGPPAAVLHLGVAGALDPDLRAGDAVWVVRVERPGSEGIDCPPDPEVRARVSVAACEGVAVTADAVVSTAAGKRDLLGAHPGALVVEMETWWAARTAREDGLPLACLRVVCDRADQAVPDLGAALDPTGRPRPLALAKRLLRRPRDAAALPGLARAFGRAQRTLADVVGDVVG